MIRIIDSRPNSVIRILFKTPQYLRWSGDTISPWDFGDPFPQDIVACSDVCQYVRRNPEILSVKVQMDLSTMENQSSPLIFHLMGRHEDFDYLETWGVFMLQINSDICRDPCDDGIEGNFFDPSWWGEIGTRSLHRVRRSVPIRVQYILCTHDIVLPFVEFWMPPLIWTDLLWNDPLCFRNSYLTEGINKVLHYCGQRNS